MRRSGFSIVVVVMVSSAMSIASEAPIRVSIQIDASKPLGEYRPVWRFFGYDEANYTYMKSGKELLAELGKLAPGQIYIRTRHLLTSGNGTPALKWSSTGAYREDAEGRAIYNWTIADRIFDTYIQCGVKPYVEIGMMPKDLSTRPDLYPTHFEPNKTVPVDAGQAYPPKDYVKWGELVHQWARHCVERYGRSEVEKWYWEVWNEPDILYWQGTPTDYYKLYDYAIDGVRRALPTARVGGPDSAFNAKFLRGFIEHCLHGTNYATSQRGSPLDFVSFHAKGNPEFVNGHVRMDLSRQLENVDHNFAAISSFEELKNIPVVIGEYDPDSMAARPASIAPQNGYRNTALFASYEAEAFARVSELAEKRGINLQGVLTWSFEFEEKPYFIGYRVLSSNGIGLPVLSVFRMFSRMSGQRLAVSSSADLGLNAVLNDSVRFDPDVHAVATLHGPKLSILAWHYHDEDVPGPSADVSLQLSGLPTTIRQARLSHYRIDDVCSNAFTAWKRMGSPRNPSGEQLAQLRQAGLLAKMAFEQVVPIKNGRLILRVDLPRQAVSLVTLTWD
jgi:xylan 1,4-beta-xylosidase